jgi:hypothetical protein
MVLWQPSLAYLALNDPRVGERSPAAVEHLRLVVADRPSLLYCVIEELIDGVVGGTATSWPHVDDRGRLIFGGSNRTFHWTHDQAAWQAQVEAARGQLGELLHPELQTQPVQVGDVYACRRSTPRSRSLVPVLDASWDARQAGRAAYLLSHARAAEPPPAVVAVAEEARFVALVEERPPTGLDVADAEQAHDVDAAYEQQVRATREVQ